MGEAPQNPLWERLGGDIDLRGVVDDLLIAAIADAKVNFTRNNRFPMDSQRLSRVENSIVDYVSSVTGGPLKYAGKEMRPAHTLMNITEAEFNTFVAHVVETLKRHKVAQAEIDLALGLRRDGHSPPVCPVRVRGIGISVVEHVDRLEGLWEGVLPGRA